METQNNSLQRAARAPPALNPESPALVQPWKEFVSKGYVRLRVEFGPMGTSMYAVPLPQIRESHESDDTRLTLGDAKARIESKGLATKRKAKGQSPGTNNQPLPLKSLCEEDFKGSDEKLLQRIRAVGTAIGSDVARSRILTHKINPEGHDDFETWWTSADGPMRASLLVDLKHAKKIGDGLAKLAELDYPCPFRGSLLPPQKKKEEKNKDVEIGDPSGSPKSATKPNGVSGDAGKPASPKKPTK